MPREQIVLDLDGHEIPFSNPGKIFWPDRGYTKHDLLEYYLAVADAFLPHMRDRPTTLKRFPDGAAGKFFFQKRVPPAAPPWLEQMTVHFPSGRNANLLVCQDRAHMAWGLNMGVIDWNPWPVRRHHAGAATGEERPDELRVDLDPTPGVPWDHVRRVALCVNEVLGEHGLTGFPKTSGSRGIHVFVRIEAREDYTEVRRAALALSREVERRMPGIATTAWWKEERQGVFLDYNQNARDRTVASAYSVRPVPNALVSAPLYWSEVPDVEMYDLRLETVPKRLKELGDPTAGMDKTGAPITSLLEMAAEDEAGKKQGREWPRHFAKKRSPSGKPKSLTDRGQSPMRK
jgi:bifunctional non-homologous end joining protein LigD